MKNKCKYHRNGNHEWHDCHLNSKGRNFNSEKKRKLLRDKEDIQEDQRRSDKSKYKINEKYGSRKMRTDTHVVRKLTTLGVETGIIDDPEIKEDIGTEGLT